MIDLESFLIHNKIKYEKNVSLRKKTWLKTGGIAQYWVEPNSVSDLLSCVEFFNLHNQKYEIVGHTSNIYYLPNYNPNIIVSTQKLTDFTEEEDCLVCECGVSVAKLSKYSVSKGWVGFSGLINLPGTIGAATYNNSSCFDCSISSLLISVDYYDTDQNKVIRLLKDDLQYSFRSSIFKRKEISGVILCVRLRKEQGDKSIETSKADAASRIRKLTQEPPAFTLGSVYAGLKYKRTVLNIFILKIASFLNYFGFDKNKIQKTLFIFINGYRDIGPCISNKNINTFKWLPTRDSFKDFMRYQSLIKTVCHNPKLEIEIRG